MINQVSDVELVRRGVHIRGSLQLTTHHLIFRPDPPAAPGPGTVVSPQEKTAIMAAHREVWVCYPILAYVERRPYSSFTGFAAMRIRCRDFVFMSMHFFNEQDCRAVYDTLMKLACVPSVDRLYAFYYHPGSAERNVNTWTIYDPIKEFQRMGVGTTNSAWRFTSINSSYDFCPTYPALLVVPAGIPDSVLAYAGKYRSKARIPTLSYIHALNNCTITRCSQPLVGLKQHRSAQDERFIHAIFSTTQVPNTYGASQENLIVDARPTTNAFAQTALGAGTENMENYKFARKVYLGIDNIHVMRDSLSKVYEALRDSDITPLPPNRELLHKSNWLKHISTIMEGAVLMGERIHYYHSHVLVHCSDGWDRTAQLSSLAQIFLDPYFRTIDGFITVVEKEWISFGHRFMERCGFLASEKAFVQLSEKSATGGGGSGTGYYGSAQMSTAEKAFSSVMSAAKSAAERAAAAAAGGGGGGGGAGYSNGNSNAAPGEGNSGNGSGSNIKYTAPIFHQFLDCVYQLLRQFPDRFEFSERFLRRMLYHLYSCQYGTFLYNNEKDRVDADVAHRAQSVWDYFVVRKREFVNPRYNPELDAADKGANAVLFPDPKNVRWWHEVFGRTEEEMSVVTLQGIGSTATAHAVVQSRRKQQQQQLHGHHHHHAHHATQQAKAPTQRYTAAPTTAAQQDPGASVYDAWKDTATSTISSWAQALADSSANTWANATAVYADAATGGLGSGIYSVDDTEDDEHNEKVSASSPYAASTPELATAAQTPLPTYASPSTSSTSSFSTTSSSAATALPPLSSSFSASSGTATFSRMPLAGLTHTTPSSPPKSSANITATAAVTASAGDLSDEEADVNAEAMSKFAALDIDPLEKYSLTHRGGAIEDYIPETE
ncbi:protein-tyrosine phosphatase-like protein [Limtongia smithiae]|uniref:protein-tyrosine phosphatase-like protein n=1 Tax=Limtongia smithiae TaxID=1125753 RepID=UPI0034CDE112